MTRRSVRWGQIASLLSVALIAASSASTARADGDPASDYLVGNQVFLTSKSGSVSPAQRQLLAVAQAANRAGFAIRVAVISTEYDLGSITALWRKPDLYARFLGQELESAYRGRLLVVMPNGFGFSWPGHSSGTTYRALASVPAGSGSDGAALAAQNAVRRLASAAGVPLHASPSVASAGAHRSGGSDTAAVLAGTIGGLALLGGLVALVLRRARRRRAGPRQLHVPVSPRWAIPGAALLCAAAVVVPILALRRSGVSSAEEASIVTPPPFSWPAGRRPAPDFALRDQAGRPVSVSAFRGRPVIVTFIDPLCRNLCPLEAQVLNRMESQLPASQRAAILAVSVDVFSNANARGNLLQTFREWHLVPQWNWAVGRPAQLAAVWKRYAIGVSVVTKRIAGTTIHYITHTEAAYVVDGRGDERALFVWPFYPQDVKRVLRELA
jgi:cytochrome oxidase Cu insertion factor (SCO1/SenC/PrrC family)